MKKVLFTFLAASLLMTVACTKNDENESEVKFSNPSTLEEAVSIDFDEDFIVILPDRAVPNDPSSAIADNLVQVKIKSIDLTEDSRYIVYIEEMTPATKGAVDPRSILIPWMGTYNFNASYHLNGIGEIALDEANGRVTFTPASGVSLPGGNSVLEIAARIIRIPALRAAAFNLARNWTVKSTYVKIKGGNDNALIAPPAFTGCDLHEIALKLKSMGVGLADADIAELVGYKVKEFNFVGNGNMIINFDGPASYYGNWSINNDQIMWELNSGNKILSAEATGTVSFRRDYSCILTVNATVTTNDNETYTGTIQFTLVHAN